MTLTESTRLSQMAQTAYTIGAIIAPLSEVMAVTGYWEEGRDFPTIQVSLMDLQVQQVERIIAALTVRPAADFDFTVERHEVVWTSGNEVVLTIR